MNNINDKNLSVWSMENSILLLLFFFAIIAVYFVPFIINQLFFFIVIILAFKSKKDYFWLAFFFLLIDAPGMLFLGGNKTDTHRIAYYPLAAGVVIQFSELLYFAYILKIKKRRNNYKFLFNKEIRFIAIYALLIVLYSLLMGMSTDTIIITFRVLLPWSLVFIVPKLFSNELEIDRLNRLLFPFVFVALISQVYSYLTGNYFGLFLKGESFRTDLLLLTADTKEAMRAADSSIILVYCFIQSILYMFSKRQVFSKKYLYLIIFGSFLSVFLSATRGWIIAYLFILAAVFITFRISTNLRYFVPLLISAALLFVVFSSLFPLINVQVKNSINRLNTMADLAHGDLTADGTLARLDKRGPRVWGKFLESPVIGWGFSDEFYKYNDGHVGHHSILLNVGIIGYFIFNYIFLKWCIQIFKLSKLQAIMEKYGKNSLKILLFALLAFYIIHSTSAQAWGFVIGISNILFYILILTQTSLIYQINFRRSLHNET